MKKQLLDLRWMFAPSEPCEGNPDLARCPGSGWLPLSASGDINGSMRDLGLLPDPHKDWNSGIYFALAEKDWWLTADFCCDFPENEDVELTFEGVDGTADIWLNDTLLGTVRNSFRPHIFRVADKLSAGENRITLRFLSLDGLMGGKREDPKDGWGDRRVLLRKPQYNFGWDWAQPVPSLGLCGGVSLAWDASKRLLDCYVQTTNEGLVDIRLETTQAVASAGYQLEVTVEGHGFHDKKILQGNSCNRYTYFRVDNPRLWWPNGLGDQPLYRYEVRLYSGQTLLDSRQGRFAFRTVRILEEPFTEDAGPGISYWFVINGKRVFIKGSNWIPTELWPQEAKDDQYRFYIHKAREANFNMLRVWGGGIYERELFYDLCDEQGILVWQDFMFASAGFPFDLVRDELVAEACWQLMRLRSHPCIAIWCGCNEDFASWAGHESAARSFRENNDVLSAGMDLSGGGEKEEGQGDIVITSSEVTERIVRSHDDPLLYTMLLRGLVSRYAPGTPYVESSPKSHDDEGNLPMSGNCHISSWKYALFDTDGHYDRWRSHFDNVCSFNSEFCIQGPCSEEYLRSFLSPAHQWPPDDVWVLHIQKGHRGLSHVQQTLWVAGATFGEIRDLTTYVRHGQATHMEQTRAEYESARQDYPNNGGTMSWMYNDCWPTANWSIIDYDRQPKPSFYAAKRACAPLLPIIFERRGEVFFSFSNHSAGDVKAELSYGVMKLDGSVVDERSCTVTVPGCQSLRFAQVDRDALSHEADEFWFIRGSADGAELPWVTYFPNMWKCVPFTPSQPRLALLEERRTASGWTYRLAVSCTGFGRYVHLSHSDKRVWFDDNWIDLPAGQTHVVTAHSVDKLDVTAFRAEDWLGSAQEDQNV